VGSFDYHPNAPLRGYTGSIWEGGHRVPFLARWPGKIKPGSTCDTLIAHLDMAATFAAIAGVDIPAGHCLDSFNVLPAFLGQKMAVPLRPHFVAHTGGTEGPFSIQSGDWKYLEVTAPIRAADSRKADKAGKAKGGGSRQPGLFNLAKDISEENNLWATEPEKLKELQSLLAKLRSAGTSK
jgi:arylsulfatase A-like enzyme